MDSKGALKFNNKYMFWLKMWGNSELFRVEYVSKDTHISSIDYLNQEELTNAIEFFKLFGCF